MRKIRVANFKKLNPIVKSLKGFFEIPKEMDYKKELRKLLDEKYL